jgi:hypothetical protein
MNTIKTLILLAIVVVFTSCSNDDEPKNHAPVSEDKEISMDENPTSDILTTIIATDLDGDTLTYSIVSQTPTGSIQINETTGEVFVMDINAFDYEQNTSIIAVIAVSDGNLITEMTLTINILDVNEAD